MPDREPEHNYEYGAEHGGYSHVGIPPGCPACAAERQKAASAATPAAAILAEIRERHAKAADFAGSGLAEIVPGLAILWESATDVAPLLAAVGRVLELAGDWDNESVRLDAVAARSFPGGDRGVIAAARAGVFQGCAEALRAAITAALTGDSESEPPQAEADRRAADEALEALRERLAGDGKAE